MERRPRVGGAGDWLDRGRDAGALAFSCSRCRFAGVAIDRGSIFAICGLAGEQSGQPGRVAP
jgi:hypothetical protein